MDKFLVTAKVNPDLDGTSCSLAYSDLLKQMGYDAEGVVTGFPQAEVKYFIEKHNIQIPVRPDEYSDKWERFVLVDASSMKGMPKVVVADKVMEIIDHRLCDPVKEFSKAKIQNELIGAAATIVVERFLEAKKRIRLDYAKLLYGAIYHNTLNFIATNATKRDINAVKYLETTYDLNDTLVREMFDFATREVEDNVQMALENDAKEFEIDNKKIGAYQLIVWGNEIIRDKRAIADSVRRIRRKFQAPWVFLNIVDLDSKKSHIFVDGPEGEKILSKALNIKFDNGWTVLPAILRKQIMPKVNEVIEFNKS